MDMIVVRCPETGRDVPTGIEIEASDLEALPEVKSTVDCPWCGVRHTWTRRDAGLLNRAVAYAA